MDCCVGKDMSTTGNGAAKYFDLHIRKDVQAVEDKRESKILYHVPPSFIATFDKIIHSDFPSCSLEITDQEKDGKKLKKIQSRYAIKKKVDGGGKKDAPEQKEEEGSQAA